MIPENIREIAKIIGEYFLERNGGDYSKTELDLLRLGISNIAQRDDGKIAITTARPGLLIGKRGETVDKLTKRLGKTIHIIEEMDPLINYLVPQKEEDDSWYENLYDYKDNWLM